jgi:hypothetical protein
MDELKKQIKDMKKQINKIEREEELKKIIYEDLTEDKLMELLHTRITKKMKYDIGENNIKKLRKLKKNKIQNVNYYNKYHFKRLSLHYDKLYKDNEDYKHFLTMENSPEKYKQIKEYHYNIKLQNLPTN